MDKTNKLRTYFYMFAVVVFIAYLIYHVLHSPIDKNLGVKYCTNEQAFIAPWPPDLIPHIREIEEDKEVRPYQPDPENNPDGIEYC